MNPNINISQKLLETVEQYLNKTLDADKLKAFEDRLKNDLEFKTQVEDIKTMLLGIEAQSLKETLDDFHKETKTAPHNITKRKTATNKSLWNFGKFAAAAAIIIAVGSIWFFSHSPNQNLYAKYFKPDPGLPTTMSSTDNYDFYDAMVNYKRGDYALAIDKWQTLLTQKPENDTLNYFIGVAHLANKNETEAIPFLERSVLSEDAFPLISDAYHYLGLAYLKDGNLTLAKKNFELSQSEASKQIIIELND
ncbi:tetratricopeptide repeat protein [Hwangdonia lutea]|uniref:Tetratricopeptide repeat protein n=1 Tax=Hwangdonia lutea TaxID=3075823 RepID=A0AA97EN02_9FLAO|nr:tetratricopeptide repeat protein [Hwangdonia sp. SCSIO 19198]WOD44152.1 tetratricopeptide repeat protein [Hwangdonia sp. SCSIO 19198]